MVSPCPCMSLQRGVTILATIQAVLAGIFLVLAAVSLMLVSAIDPKDYPDITQTAKNLGMVFLIILIILLVFQLLLALYLRKAALANNYHNLRKWLIIAIVLLVLGIVSSAMSISARPTALEIVSQVFEKVYHLYVMLVVWCLMKEIDNAGMSNYYSSDGNTNTGP